MTEEEKRENTIRDFKDYRHTLEMHKDEIVSGLKVALMTSHLTPIVRDSLSKSLRHAEAIRT